MDLPVGIIATNLPSNTIVFNAVRVNKTEKKSFLIFNSDKIGGADVTIYKIEIAENRADDFFFSVKSSPKVPFILKAGGIDKKEIVVQFSPNQNQTFTGYLYIKGEAQNLDSHSNFEISLRHKVP
jgi:L-asparaginase/Glu-tRNA(Gln) amidotransferase subunit D